MGRDCPCVCTCICVSMHKRRRDREIHSRSFHSSRSSPFLHHLHQAQACSCLYGVKWAPYKWTLTFTCITARFNTCKMKHIYFGHYSLDGVFIMCCNVSFLFTQTVFDTESIWFWFIMHFELQIDEAWKRKHNNNNNNSHVVLCSVYDSELAVLYIINNKRIMTFR